MEEIECQTFLSFEDIYKILYDEYSWYHTHRNYFYSICESVKRLDNNMTPEDIKHDFILYTQEKNEKGELKRQFKFKSGLIFSLVNYAKGAFRKSKKKSVKDYDVHLYNEYYSEIFDNFGLSKYDKKYLSYFIAKQGRRNISPIMFGLDNLVMIHDKGDKYGGRAHRIIRTKIIKLNYFYITLLATQVIDELDDYDRLFIQFIRDTFTNGNVAQYYGSLEIFDKSGKYANNIKQYLTLGESNGLLLKILKLLGVEI